MAKETLMKQEIDVVLLAIEMTKQAQHVDKCWSLLKMINQACRTYPKVINDSIGYYRTVFDSLVTSVFIGLGRLYDKDADSFSLYSLRALLGVSFKDAGIDDVKAYSQKLNALAPRIGSLRYLRGKQYAHNDRKLAWQSDWLTEQFPLSDEDIEALIQFAKEYCDFFSMMFLGAKIEDWIPPCDDFWNTMSDNPDALM